MIFTAIPPLVGRLFPCPSVRESTDAGPKSCLPKASGGSSPPCTKDPKWQQQASGLLLPFGAQSTLLSPCTPRGQGEGSPYAASRLSPLSALRASERCTDRQERNVGRCQIFPIIFKSHHENLFDAKVAYSIPSFFYRSYHSNRKDPG